MNLGFPDLVCDHMMDKAINNINCGEVSDRQKSFTQANITTNVEWNNKTQEFNSTNHDFEMEVCRAELESQKLGSTISAYIAPFGKDSNQITKKRMDHNQLFSSDSAIGIVLVLFAGNWSDKSGRRKPCILVPQIGDLLAQSSEKMI